MSNGVSPGVCLICASPMTGDGEPGTYVYIETQIPNAEGIPLIYARVAHWECGNRAFVEWYAPDKERR